MIQSLLEGLGLLAKHRYSTTYPSCFQIFEPKFSRSDHLLQTASEEGAGSTAPALLTVAGPGSNEPPSPC